MVVTWLFIFIAFVLVLIKDNATDPSLAEDILCLRHNSSITEVVGFIVHTSAQSAHWHCTTNTAPRCLSSSSLVEIEGQQQLLYDMVQTFRWPHDFVDISQFSSPLYNCRGLTPWTSLIKSTAIILCLYSNNFVNTEWIAFLLDTSVQLIECMCHV